MYPITPCTSIVLETIDVQFLKITQKAFGARDREASILNFSWGKSAFYTTQTITASKITTLIF